MPDFKVLLPTMGLVVAMAFSTFANGGIVVNTFTNGELKDTCTAKVDWGVVVQGFGGVVVQGFGGVVVQGFGGVVVQGIKILTGGTDGCETKK
jgi:hypothetical protein